MQRNMKHCFVLLVVYWCFLPAPRHSMEKESLASMARPTELSQSKKGSRKKSIPATARYSTKGEVPDIAQTRTSQHEDQRHCALQHFLPQGNRSTSHDFTSKVCRVSQAHLQSWASHCRRLSPFLSLTSAMTARNCKRYFYWEVQQKLMFVRTTVNNPATKMSKFPANSASTMISSGSCCRASAACTLWDRSFQVQHLQLL